MSTRKYYGNDFSIYNPVIWAREAMKVFGPNMKIANLIHRDYDNLVAMFGDTVNARVPASFEMTRKGAKCDNIVVQDASFSRVQAKLNQWPQVNFFICDGEENRGMLDLINDLLVPAVEALARAVDRIIAQQVYGFRSYVAGKLGTVDKDNIADYIIETRQLMNMNYAPEDGRILLLTPNTESAGLQAGLFVETQKAGQNTTLATGRLAPAFGFDLGSTQQTAYVSATQVKITGTVNDADGCGIGETSITYDNGASLAPGQWCVIAGDDTPQHITADSGTVLTISPGLRHAVADNAVITVIKPGAVNNSGGYIGTSSSVIGWAKEILVDGMPNSAPQVGQMVTFGTSLEVYSIIKVRVIDKSAGTFGILLDQPLQTAIADDATVNLGPAGEFNFAFVRNALTLINRPLPMARAGTGALQYVTNDPKQRLSIRVSISYDSNQQGHLVTLDFLMGVNVMDDQLGAILLG